jgi:hypothetical protein
MGISNQQRTSFFARYRRLAMDMKIFMKEDHHEIWILSKEKRD